MDYAGAVTVSSGVGLLMLGLTQGQLYGFDAGWIVASMTAGVAFLALFCWIELRVAEPILDLQLFVQNRVYWVMSLVSFLMGVGMFGDQAAIPGAGGCGLRPLYSGLCRAAPQMSPLLDQLAAKAQALVQVLLKPELQEAIPQPARDAIVMGVKAMMVDSMHVVFWAGVVMMAVGLVVCSWAGRLCRSRWRSWRRKGSSGLSARRILMLWASNEWDVSLMWAGPCLS